jgi:hypothetical protein
MATLPTITVSDAQLALLMESFAGTFGGPGQPATVADAYKAWLIGNLKAKVYGYKASQLTQQHNAALEQAMIDMKAQLDAVMGA